MFTTLKYKNEILQHKMILTYCSILEIYALQKEEKQMKELIDEAQAYVDNDEDYYQLQATRAKLELLKGNSAAYEKMMRECIHYFYNQNMWKVLHYLKLADEMIDYYKELEDHKHLSEFLKIQSDIYRHLCEEASII